MKIDNYTQLLFDGHNWIISENGNTVFLNRQASEKIAQEITHLEYMVNEYGKEELEKRADK